MRRPGRPQRRRIFLGCEGESERSYGVLIGRMLDCQGLAVHLDAVVLNPGSGDPLALIERARKVIERNVANRGDYAFRAVLLDSDKLGVSAEREARLDTVARQAGIHLIWQEPCHEAVLLRHVAGCDQLRPQTSAAAIAELRKCWPDYQKGWRTISIQSASGAQRRLNRGCASSWRPLVSS